MCDYIPEYVVIEILKRLTVKSLVRFRSICKSWNSVICDPCFISTHLQASLSNSTPFLLLRYENYYLHYDNDGFDKFKQLQFPPFGSCNGLICVRLYPFDNFIFFLWNPSIQKYISLPQVKISKVVYLNVGFGVDLRTNDYKLLIVVVCKIGGPIEPYLFSLNGNCWKRVTANPPNYAFDSRDMTFVNGVVHWLGFKGRNNFGCNWAILGFDMSVEEFFEMKLPESLFGFHHVDLSIMKYGESSITSTTHPLRGVLHELWVMKEYGVVDSWTKVLTLHRCGRHAWIPRVLEFRKNREVLLRVDDEKITSLDLYCQQMEAPLYFNCQQMELNGVEVVGDLESAKSYVESIVFLDKAVNFCSKNGVNHPIDSSDWE